MDLVMILRIVLGYILLLFIPGYAITWALYPTREELEFIERIALSFVLSIVSVMLSVLFTDTYLGIDVTPLGIVVTVSVVTVLAVILWGIRRAYAESHLKGWIRRRFGRGPEDTRLNLKDSKTVQELWDTK